MTCGFPIPARRWRLGLLALWLVAARLAGADVPPAGEGQPLMQYFSPRDYRGGTQYWTAAQDARGVMYVGTIGAVLEYDGAAWRKVAVPEGEVVTALGYAPADDTVFVGAVNDLGRLETSPGGEHRYVSLLDRVPAAESRLTAALQAAEILELKAVEPERLRALRESASEDERGGR